MELGEKIRENEWEPKYALDADNILRATLSCRAAKEIFDDSSLRYI